MGAQDTKQGHFYHVAGDSSAWRFAVVIISGVVVCFLLLAARVSAQQDNLSGANRMLAHTHEVMMLAMTLSADVQRMTVSARGYLLTRDGDLQSSARRYEEKSRRLIDELVQMTRDNPHQSKRLQRVGQQFDALTAILVDEKEKAFVGKNDRKGLINPVGNHASLDLQALLDEFTAEEEVLLNQRLESLSRLQTKYDQALYGGICVAALAIIVLNLLLLKLYQRKRRLRATHEATEARLALAMRSTSDGIFDWDIEAGTIYYSPRFKQMIGYGEFELEDTRDAVHALIHEEDLPGVVALVNDYLEGRMSEFNAVYRIQHKAGGYLWLHARARAVRDKHGRPIRMVGATADITAIKAIEERLRVEKEIAVQANKAKTDFLTNMSHEIRTPLNAIIGVSGILAKHMARSKEQ